MAYKKETVSELKIQKALNLVVSSYSGAINSLRNNIIDNKFSTFCHPDCSEGSMLEYQNEIPSREIWTGCSSEGQNLFLINN